MKDTPQYIRPQQAASTLGLPIAWLNRQIEAGHIPYISVGRSRRVRLGDVTSVLEQWLEAGHEMPKQDDSGGDS